MIKYKALLHKPQLFIGSLERSRRAESETSRTFERKYFLVKLRGKEIYGPSGPNIYLPDAMVRCT